MGFSRCAQAQLPLGLWDLLQPGIEAVSPALAGGVLITGPAGKSKAGFLKDFVMVRLGRRE